MRKLTAIIKVVGDFCNMRCGYCFYNRENQSVSQLMNLSLLNKFIRQYLNLFSGKVSFIWHGGEPLLAGIDYFGKIIESQNTYKNNNHDIKNFVQTNGTLINDDWAIFFKKHRFRVGVSLDGSSESHDSFRKDAGGNGTFERVVSGIKTLKKHGIYPGIIQTLTEKNTVNIKTDLDFFVNVLGLKSLSINLCLDINNNSCIEQRFIDYLKACVDLWLLSDKGDLRIREIDNFLCGVLKKRATSCSFNGFCADYFCLDYNGKIYPCDRFSKLPEFLFGDLSKQDLNNVLNSKQRLSYLQKIHKPNIACIDCGWKDACNNGCPSHRIGGIEGKYFFCKLRKSLFDYMNDMMEKMQNKEVIK